MASRIKRSVGEKGAGLNDLERLYRRRYPHFVQVARAVVGDEQAAYDAVQDGFALALRKRASFRGEGPLEAWVWRTVLNAALMARRLNGAFEPFEQVSEPASRDTRDEGAQIRAWVAILPERQKLAVFLRYYADLDYRAIASALEVEVGTVSASLSAAHSALRRAIEAP